MSARGDSEKPSSEFQTPRQSSNKFDSSEYSDTSVPPLPLTDFRHAPDSVTTQLAVSGETPSPASLQKPKSLFSKLASNPVHVKATPKVAAQASVSSSFEKAQRYVTLQRDLLRVMTPSAKEGSFNDSASVVKGHLADFIEENKPNIIKWVQEHELF